MPYAADIATEEDFPELINALYDSFETPFYSILYVFIPPDRKFGTQRELQEFKEAKGEIVWVKIYDSDDPKKKIVGGAKWYFFQRDPHTPRPGQEQFVHPLKQESDWWPEGSITREFSTRLLRQHNAPRILWTEGKPHCYLHFAFTLLEHRRKGVATKYLEWGVKRADELGLECYLEASTLGAPVYRRHGFVDGPVTKAAPEMPEDYTEQQKAEWQKLEKEQLPCASLEMWRPVKGVFVEGTTVCPWDK